MHTNIILAICLKDLLNQNHLSLNKDFINILIEFEKIQLNFTTSPILRFSRSDLFRGLITKKSGRAWKDLFADSPSKRQKNQMIREFLRNGSLWSKSPEIIHRPFGTVWNFPLNSFIPQDFLFGEYLALGNPLFYIPLKMSLNEFQRIWIGC